MLIGTGHALRSRRPENTQPEPQEIKLFLDDINAAVNGLELTDNDILHIYSGVIPVKPGPDIDFVKEDILVDHGSKGGVQGLYSLCSTKLTATHSAAHSIVRTLFGAYHHNIGGTRPGRTGSSERGKFAFNWLPDAASGEWKNILSEMIRNDHVNHLDDLMLRRTTIGDNPLRAIAIADEIAQLFDWDENRKAIEIERLKDHYTSLYHQGARINA